MIKVEMYGGVCALLDDEDADLAAFRYWRAGGRGSHNYAMRHIWVARGTYHRPLMHREIAERMLGGPIPKGMVVDHINGNTLDNRRSNLRVTTQKVNTWNQHGAGRDSKSGVRGVRKYGMKWAAYICEGKRMISLGYHATIEAAQAAREAAEQRRAEGLPLRLSAPR